MHASFFIAAKDTYSKEIEHSLLHNRNLELLTYDNSNGTHEQLLNELNNLVPKVEDRRHEIIVQGKW